MVIDAPDSHKSIPPRPENSGFAHDSAVIRFLRCRAGCDRPSTSFAAAAVPRYASAALARPAGLNPPPGAPPPSLRATEQLPTSKRTCTMDTLSDTITNELRGGRRAERARQPAY